MKKIRNSETFTWLTVFSLVFSLVAGILVCDQANAQTRRESTPATKAAKDSHSLLAKYADDLTQQAREGAFAPGQNFDRQIKRTIRVLAGDASRNVMLLDDAGVAKLQIAQGVALRVAQGDVPASLRSKSVFSLNLAKLTAEASDANEVATRLQSVTNEIAKASDVILFVDSMEGMVGAGAVQGPRVAAIVEAALQKGELRVIGATTRGGYEYSIGSSPELATLFEKIVINADADVAANDDKETSDDHSFAGDKVSPELREMMQAKGANSVEAILRCLIVTRPG